MAISKAPTTGNLIKSIFSIWMFCFNVLLKYKCTNLRFILKFKKVCLAFLTERLGQEIITTNTATVHT